MDAPAVADAGRTVYTFSIILAVFLVGLGIGSSAGSWLARDAQRARACCWAGARSASWSASPGRALLMNRAFPTGRSIRRSSPSPWFNFQLDLAARVWRRASGRVLVGRELSRWRSPRSRARGEDPARLVGGVYAANTVGAIVGALAFSLLLIPALGTQDAQQLLIV